MAAALKVTFLGTQLQPEGKICVSDSVYARWGDGGATHPTLTHVPPSRFPSITIALAPYRALAARAAPSPPLPPPITRKSVSLEIGAMASEVAEKCRESALIRLADALDERRGRLTKRERGCMGGVLPLRREARPAGRRGGGGAIYREVTNPISAPKILDDSMAHEGSLQY